MQLTEPCSPKLLRSVADRGAADLAGATAEDVIVWAAQEFGDRVIATQSMVNTALSTLIAAVAPVIPVVFLDTGYHFEETLDTLERVRAKSGLTIISISSTLSIEEQSERFGPDLWSRNPDLCCSIRKERPLEEILANHDAWLTGLRRETTEARRDTRTIAYDADMNVVKVSPLLDWSDSDLAAFTSEHEVEVNPLTSQGFPSIGCRPCTRPVESGEDSRAGRWSGFDKTECGIHR